MELKYTEVGTVVNNDNSMVNMLLFGAIDQDDPLNEGVNSTDFVREMMFWNIQGKHVQVKIHCPGGSVFGGNAIQNTVEEIGADTYIVGMAASMGGVVAQSGRVRIANHRAALMMHPPSGGSKDLIKICKKSLTKDLTEKSALSEEEVNNIVNGKNDVWFDADEMYAKGLVDRLVKSGTKLTNVKNRDRIELYTAYNSLLNNQNPIKMEKVMNHLGLVDKTEADVLNVVKELETKAAKVEGLNTQVTNLTEEKGTLETKVDELTTEVTNLKEERVTELKNKAEALVNNAVKEGRLDEKSKDGFLQFAIENYDAASQALEGLSVTKTKGKAMVDKSKDGNQESKEMDYETMAIKDPKGLTNLMENDSEKFDALLDAHNIKIRNLKKA
jgi:ATP-dependent protease ClpP protease subunit